MANHITPETHPEEFEDIYINGRWVHVDRDGMIYTPDTVYEEIFEALAEVGQTPPAPMSKRHLH